MGKYNFVKHCRSTLALIICICVSLEGEFRLDAAAPEKALIQSVLLPIGVTDSSFKTGYVPNSNGGVDAITLDNGQKLWSVADVVDPIIVGQNVLIGRLDAKRRSTLQLAVLDLKNKGELLITCEPIELPTWVSVAPVSGQVFQLTAAIDESNVYVTWQCRARYGGGAAPSKAVEDNARKAASGSYRINLKDGKVAHPDPATESALGESPLPESLGQLESIPYLFRGEVKTDPVKIGQHWVAFSQTEQGDQSVLQLKQWNSTSGKLVMEKQLAGVSGDEILISVDRQHAFFKSEDKDGKASYSIVNLADAERSGQITLPLDAAAPVKFGSRIYFLLIPKVRAGKTPARQIQPIERRLSAIDANSSREIWTYPVRGTQVLPLAK